MIKLNILLVFIIFGISLSNSYRILAIFPFNGRSHHNVLQPIAMALAAKGHQVDVISHFQLKEPVRNYTDIIKLPSSDYPRLDYYGPDIDIIVENTWVNKYKSRMCDLLGLPEIANLIKNPPTDQPYDLLLVHFMTGYQCFAAIGHHWDIPVAGIVTTAAYTHMKTFIGEPQNLAIFQSHLEFYKEKMNFWDRVYNVIKTHYVLYYYHKFADMQDHYIKKYIGADMPSYRELETKLSILLSNSHYSFYGVKPTVPALVEIGGINIKHENSTLSPKLRKYLDESKTGFIYFSFGSIFAIESLPNEVLERFYKVLREISPVRVLMRVPNPDNMPKKLPDNVLTHTWLPQQQILKHPNIKAFVTHGGGLGTQEAIYYKVPMICVPFFAEQHTNCDILSSKNVSIKIDLNTARQKDYDDAFQKILNNPLYKESMRKFSNLYWDRIQSPKDTATYWIEYVIRHGKNVLRSPTVDLKWWQVDLLDVYGFILICMITILFIVIFSLKLICKLLIRKLCSKKIAVNKKLN